MASETTRPWSGNREATIYLLLQRWEHAQRDDQFLSFWFVFPEARINPNGVITGYGTPGTVIDFGGPGGLSAPDCPPSPDGIDVPTIEVTYGSWFDTHLFFIAVSGESGEIPYLLVK